MGGECNTGLWRAALFLGGAADRQAVDAQRRLADAYRHALAFLAAGADAGVEGFMSLPIMVTRVSASGPLPTMVAPLTGYWILPFSTQ